MFEAVTKVNSFQEDIPNTKATIFIWTPTVQFSTTYAEKKLVK